MGILKVSGRSNPKSVAGALAGIVRQTGSAEVQVVGAGALNQAVKAVAIARSYLEDAGLDLVCTPTFADIEIDGEERTAIRLRVDDRALRTPAPAAEPVATLDLEALSADHAVEPAVPPDQAVPTEPAVPTDQAVLTDTEPAARASAPTGA